jgi:redox-sensing transcriptional repressor
MTNISEKTVERLIRCRRELLKYQYLDKPHVFSSDLARMLNIRPEQLRQDIMSIGVVSGNNRKGYDVNNLIKAIEESIKIDEFSKVAFIGDPVLVSLFKNFIENNFLEFNIDVIFNFSQDKDSYDEIPCYSLDKMPAIIKENNIEIAIVAVDADLIADIVDTLRLNEIKGIVNLTSEIIKPEKGMFVENYDLLSIVEKLNFTIKTDYRLKK